MTVLRAAVDLRLPAGRAGGRGGGWGAPAGVAGCARCGAELGPPRDWAPPGGLPRLVGVTHWSGAARALVLAHKENARAGLRTPLGAALAVAVRSLVGDT